MRFPVEKRVQREGWGLWRAGGGTWGVCGGNGTADVVECMSILRFESGS